MSLKHRFKEHTNSVSCCHVLPGGQLVASGDEGGQLCIHDTESSALTTSSNIQSRSDDGGITSICSSAVSGGVLYASAGPDVHILDLRTGIAPVQSYAGFCRDEINQMAVNSKATHLATADDAGDIKVMDLAAGKLYKAIKESHEPLATSVSFRSHRPWELITGGMDATVARWDFSRGKCLNRWSMSTPNAAAQENQLLNPPFVHAIAVPQVASSCRPWCQLVGVARGDGAVALFDGDAGMPTTMNTQSAASTSEASGSQQDANDDVKATGNGSERHDRRKGAAKLAKKEVAGNGVGGKREGKASSNAREWAGPHLWQREEGGHNRPASCVEFSWAGGSDNSSFDQSATPPSLLISGSEDRRILAWRIQNQPVIQTTQSSSEHIDSTQEGSASDACSQQDAQDTASASLLHFEIKHTAKINCIAAGQGLSRQLLFVGDTKNRLCIYDVPPSGSL